MSHRWISFNGSVIYFFFYISSFPSTCPVEFLTFIHMFSVCFPSFYFNVCCLIIFINLHVFLIFFCFVLSHFYAFFSFVCRFPETTCHFILNSDNATVCSAAVHRIQHKLHLIHHDIFPLLSEKEVHFNFFFPSYIKVKFVYLKCFGKDKKMRYADLFNTHQDSFCSKCSRNQLI